MSRLENPVSPRTSLFFLLTLGLTWTAWLPAAVEGSAPTPILFALGGISPSLWGVLLIYRCPLEARRDFWRRVVDPSRIRLIWWLVLGLLFPFIMLITLAVVAAAGAELPSTEPALRTLSSPLRFLVFLGIMLIGGPLAEELGWRGFALDRLQARHSALSASLILAAVSLLWHIPLFFMERTSQGEMGFATLLFWGWTVREAAGHILHTWVYNNCRRSTLAAIIFHFMSNAVFSLVAGVGGVLPEDTAIVLTLLHVAAVLIVTGMCGPRRLVRTAGPGGRPNKRLQLPSHGAFQSNSGRVWW